MKFGGNNLREAATKEAFDCLVLSTKKYVTLLRETSILACIYIYIYPSCFQFTVIERPEIFGKLPFSVTYICIFAIKGDFCFS
jgi:hypothetical protein